MNSRVLKIIAVVSMLVDHMGSVLFPSQTWMRIIGRIAFPIFCFLIAYGVTKTRSIWKYLLRLFIFALVTQTALFLVKWEIDFSWLNVFFTLSAGVLSIILIRKIRQEGSYVISVCLMVIIAVIILSAELLCFDYGMMGVFLIITFYVALSYSLKTFKIALLPILIVFNLPYLLSDLQNPVQIYSMFSFLFLVFFADRKLIIPKWERWAFYVFYPLHLVVLNLIKIFLM